MISENDGFGRGSEANEDRRKFLAICGKFAVVTPPAITMLLSTSLNSTVVAQSAGHSNGGGPRGNNGGGNGGGDGSPNGKEDDDR